MIEMLGVLAIVGILTVAGITGFSKALYKYRMNQTVDIVSGIIQSGMEFLSKDPGKTNLGHDQLVDFIYPECKKLSGTACSLPTKDAISLQFMNRNHNASGFNRFTLTINMNGDDKEKKCVDFLSNRWENLIPQLLYLRTYDESMYNGSDSSWAFYLIDNQSKKTYTTEEIVTNCKKACSNEGASACNVNIAFY